VESSEKVKEKKLPVWPSLLLLHPVVAAWAFKSHKNLVAGQFSEINGSHFCSAFWAAHLRSNNS
jgi:hypothetical protein